MSNPTQAMKIVTASARGQKLRGDGDSICSFVSLRGPNSLTLTTFCGSSDIFFLFSRVTSLFLWNSLGGATVPARSGRRQAPPWPTHLRYLLQRDSPAWSERARAGASLVVARQLHPCDLALMGSRFPVGDLRVLLIIERAARAHNGNRLKVIMWRRRRGIPLQGEGIPGVIASALTAAHTANHIPDEDQNADSDNESANGLQQVHLIPAQVGRIGIDTAAHAEQAEYLHGEEGQVQTDEEEPELYVAQAFAQHPACHLGEPVVDGREDGKDATAEQHIVDVRNDKVGIRHLVVERHNRQGHAVEAADQEHGDEAQGKEHGDAENDLAAEDCRDPVEHLDGGRDGDERRAGGEEGLRDERQTDGEHMVRPHGEAQEANGNARPRHKGIAKDRLAREGRQHVRNDAKGRQDQDVDLRVAEGPEEVLPEQRVAAEGVLVEMGAEVAVEQQQAAGRRQARNGEEQQERRDQRHPDEERHAVNGHTGGAHFQNGDDEIERAGDGRDTEQQNAEYPEVHIEARGTLEGFVAAGVQFCKRRVGEPAIIGGCIEQEARRHEQAAEQHNPVAKSVQARESHIARAYHQRHDIVTKTNRHGHHEEEDHREAMHGEYLVIGLRVEDLAVRDRQLRANEQGLHATDQEKEKGGNDVHNADLFMIDGGQPLPDIRFGKGFPFWYNTNTFYCTGCHWQILHSPAR